MSSMFPCISDSPSRTNVLTIIFLLVAPRCRDVCNVCQHEWWAVGSTRVASTRGMPLSMHISPSLLPSFARPCQDHEELIGAFLLSCAPGQARARRRPASAAAAAAATTTVAAAAVTTTTMAAEVQPHLPITRRAVFHPGRCHFARLTSGKSRYVPIRPRYERICTQKHTARQWAPSKTDLERPQWRARCALPLLSGGETR